MNQLAVFLASFLLSMLSGPPDPMRGPVVQLWWEWANEGAMAAGLSFPPNPSRTYRIEQLHAACPIGIYGCGQCPTDGGTEAVAVSAYNDRVTQFCDAYQSANLANSIYRHEMGIYHTYNGSGGGGDKAAHGCPPSLLSYPASYGNECRCVYDRFSPDSECHP
jgi:hypothetical protein